MATLTVNEIHTKRAFHNPTWEETVDTLLVDRDYQAEARCRAYRTAWQTAWREGREKEFLDAHPRDQSSEYREER
jgi:hypothetical protein